MIPLVSFIKHNIQIKTKNANSTMLEIKQRLREAAFYLCMHFYYLVYWNKSIFIKYVCPFIVFLPIWKYTTLYLKRLLQSFNFRLVSNVNVWLLGWVISRYSPVLQMTTLLGDFAYIGVLLIKLGEWRNIQK